MRYKIVGYYRKQYQTQRNDTFDKLALDFYGDEKVASYLIDANPEHSNVILFEAGVMLNLPKLEQIETTTLPQWKGGFVNGL